jgi:hypothetical protein
LKAGSNLVTVRATDTSGNVAIATVTIIYENPAAPDPSPVTSPRYTINDALQALMIALGKTTSTSYQLARLDVAPLINGVSTPNGRVDTNDVIGILRMAVGLI